MKRTHKLAASLIALSTMSLAISGCSGVSLVKQGESDAVSACNELRKLEDGGADISVDAAMAGLFTAEGYAQSASEQNDDYVRLSDAVSALIDSLMYGSEAMANTAWGSVANICNSL